MCNHGVICKALADIAAAFWFWQAWISNRTNAAGSKAGKSTAFCPISHMIMVRCGAFALDKPRNLGRPTVIRVWSPLRASRIVLSRTASPYHAPLR